MRYPILYAADTTDFSNMGLGALSDTISCKCTQSAEDYEIELTYPINGVNYADICHSAFIKVVVPPLYETSPQLFRIYKITKPINGIITVNAEHIYHQLSYIPVSQFTSGTVYDFFAGITTNALEACPFTFTTNMPAEHIRFVLYNPASILNLLSSEEGRLQDLIYGEFLWDNYNVTFNDEIGHDNGVEFRYGVNITDLEQEENILETVTGVCPYWRGYDANDNVVTILTDEKVLHSTAAANYPFQRTIPLDCSNDFEEMPTSAELKQFALDWMDAHEIGYPEVNITVEVADIAKTPGYTNFVNLFKADLYDTVTVVFDKLGVKKKAKVVETVYDVLLQRYDSYEIGDIQKSLSSSIADVAEKSNVKIVESVSDRINKILEGQADFINKGLGGHVVINTNSDGYPNEILIMDTDDISTAVNVLRINMNGIAFSTQGYAGPYNTAWTIDGKLVADYIASGTINAIDIVGSLIKGSSLIFGDDPNTTELRTNDAKTGALFEGQGVMEFNTVGMFDATNRSAQSTYDGSTIRMANDTSNSGRNYINLMNYRPDKSSDGYYAGLANSVYITANNTSTTGNTMRFQNYTWDSSSYTGNQMLLRSIGTYNDTHIYNYDGDTPSLVANTIEEFSSKGQNISNRMALINYDKAGLTSNEIRLSVGNSIVGTQTTISRTISFGNNEDGGLRANYFLMNVVPSTKYTDIEFSNYDLTNSTDSSRVYANTLILRSQTTSKTAGIYNRKLADGNYANYLQMTGASTANTTALYNYAMSTTNVANYINMYNNSSTNESAIYITNRDKNGNSLRNEIYMVDNASTQYIRIANFAGTTLRNSLYGVLNGSTSEIGLHANDTSGSETSQITCNSNGKLYVKANGHGAWGCGWIQVNGTWVLGYVA